MDVLSFIQNNGMKEVNNPNYNPRSKKNTQPATMMVPDTTPHPDLGVSLAIMDYNNQYSISAKENEKYSRFGLNYNPRENLDKQLAELQSAGSKWWNAIKQTVVSELGLGTAKAFTDLADVISGAIFDSDNDYTNPASAYLAELQEEYRNNNPIHADPDKNLFNGGLLDAGWWASNVPSIASSLTLLVPGAGFTKVLGIGTKVLGAGKAAKFLRRSLMTKKNLERLKAGEKLTGIGNFARWANKSSTATAANRILENGITAAAMRTIENYQEATQVYDDMYEQASEQLNRMNPEQYQNWVNNNAEELQSYGVDVNDRTAVARAMAKHSADLTFKIDYANTIFDVAQLYALKNPLKLAKNMRNTSAVRTAERQARRYAGAKAEDVAKLEAERKFGTKAKDYLSDHLGALGIIGAESSEGVEEAINYIAQQEGMHYGNMMLNPEDNKHTKYFENRLMSYLASPELYDAAFWGVMGGVVFQSAGSGLNSLRRAANVKIKEAQDKKKHKTDTTQETTNTNWREALQTSETRARVSEIESRQEALNTLRTRLDDITNNNVNPFRNSTEEQGKKATITSDAEKQAAIDRAIDEYVVGMAFRAMENGNYDMLKSYLRDENVKKALIDANIISESDSDIQIEDFIKRMDEVEQLYNDNMIVIDDLSSSTDVPFEYIQIIAKDNALAQIEDQRLDKQLSGFRVSAENNRRRFGDALDADIDYQGAVELIAATRKLATLRAQKKQILADRELAKSVDGQNALAEINNQIKLVNNHIFNDNLLTSEDDNITSMHDKLAKLLWATGVSHKMTVDGSGRYSTSVPTAEYADFLEALATRDMKKIKELAEFDFDATDEDIIRLLGEGEKISGSYSALSQDLDRAYDEKAGLKANASSLNDDYEAIAALKLAKLEVESTIANTKKKVDDRVNELHNNMNEARKKAVAESQKIIFELAKKYGGENMAAHIFSNEEIANMTDEEKTKLNNALSVLNLTAASNVSLGNNLKWTLMLADAHRESTEAVTGEENATSENQESATENQGSNNTPQEQQNSNTEEQSSQNGQQSQQTPNQQPQTQPMKIKTDVNGNVSVDTNVGENEVSYDAITNPDGTIELSIPKGVLMPDGLGNDGWARDSIIWEGYDANLENDATKERKVVSNPVLAKDANGNYSVVSKGVFQYVDKGANSSQNPSTGQLNDDSQTAPEAQPNPAPVAPSPTPVAEPAAEPAQAPATPVAEPSFTDIEIENLENDIQQEILSQFRTRDKSRDAREVIAEIEQNVKEAHKNDKNKKDVERAIARGIKNLTYRATKSGLIKDIATAMSSSVTERPNGKYDLSQEYIDAMNTLLDNFCRQAGIREIAGKRYIVLENMLREFNNIYGDSSVAASMYGAMRQFLESEAAKAKFVVVDKESTNIVENANKTVEQRITEKIGEEDKHRVAIDKLFEKPTQAFLDSFDSINMGDKLQADFNNGKPVLKKNGVIVGMLPTPKIDSRTGRMYQYNEGWKTDVAKENGEVVSNLKEVFARILQEDNDVAKAINDNIARLLHDKTLTDKQKNDLIEDTYNKLTKDLNLTDFISDKASHRDVVAHLAKLWRYFDTKASSPEYRNQWIEVSLDRWFEKMYDSYSTMTELADILVQNPNGIDIEVSNITSGELVRNVTEENASNSNYDKFTQANEAFGTNSAAEIAIVSRTSSDTIITASGKVITNPSRFNASNGASSGKCYFVIPNKNGVDNYVVAPACRINDGNLTGDAKEIIKAVREELSRLVDEAFEKENYDALYDFIHKLCYKTYDKGTASGIAPNTPLFANIGFSKKSQYGDEFTINALEANAVQLNIHREKNGIREFRISNPVNRTFQTYTFNDKENKDVFKQALMSIIDKSYFNLDFSFFDLHTTSNGFISRSTDGKVNIWIPNSADSSRDFSKTYNSFNDAVIQAGLVRTNTHQENGSNYRRKGQNQAANQILEVSIKRVNSSPVEDNATPQTTKKSNAESILTNPDISDKATALVETALSSEQLKTLNDLHLLPANVIFDENFNERASDGTWLGDNAAAMIEDNPNNGRKKGQTIVGRRWLDMFNEEGEFAGYTPGEAKKQAIRKLIHEQLHHKLNANKRERAKYLSRIEEIYNDFKQALEDKNIPQDSNLRQYLFTEEEKDIALEEFLVESLTSSDLVDFLNSVQVDFEKSKTSQNLWQKFLKLIGDIFGWKIEKGSLREKELHILAKEISDIGKEVKKAETKVKKPTVKPTDTSSAETAVTEAKPDTSNEVTLDDIRNAKTGFGRNRNRRGSSVTERSNEYTPEMNDIKAKAIADGSFMKAPNGNLTNLSERQWLQVRTKNFKAWFGDWQNSPRTASKVVDENGEPLVVAHFTNNDFNIFDKNKIGSTDVGDYGKGFYFTGLFDDNETENRYGNKRLLCFLNIKNPISDSENQAMLYNRPIPNKYDGVIVGRFKDEVVVKNPNQIKSATNNNGEFSTTDANIRHSSITEKPTPVPSISDFENTLSVSQQAVFISQVNAGEIQTRCR